MRRLLGIGLAVLLVTATLAQSPAVPTDAQGVAILGDAPYLANGAVVAASAGGEIVSAASVPSVDISSRSDSANFYATYYGGQPAIGWTGSQASCTAGTTTGAFKSAVIDRVAFYRAMAGVPSAVGLAADASVGDQQAALMFSRNNQLSHTPPSSWACYTSAGAQAAGGANIALGVYGVSAIDAYMKDAGGGNTAAGHRRWILFPQTQSFGTGDVPPVGTYSPANALAVWDSNVGGARPSTRDGFVAWPPPGYVPYQIVFPRWSFSYPGASFGGATVTVTLNGVSLPVSIDSSTATGYGENTIVFRPNSLSDYGNWPNPGSDATYTVRIAGVVVGGVSRTYSYDVTIFDPSTSASSTYTPTGSPTSTPTPSTTFTPSSTPTRTSTPLPGTATRTPTLIPGGYAPGDLFMASASLSLRSGPGTSYSRIAVLPGGTVGQVTGYPVIADGYTFYPVTVTGYGSGWAAGEYFTRVAATPTPSSTRTATTAPTATPSRTATSASQQPTSTPTRVPGTFQSGDTVRTTANVNLRSGPSTGSSVITVVSSNSTGTVTGAGVVGGSYTFYPVTFAGYGSGWIAGQYLALVNVSEPQPQATNPPSDGTWAVGTTVYTNTALNIRTGPGTGYSVRGVAAKGTEATVTGSPVVSGSVTWYPLNVTGLGDGWASSSYLSLAPETQGPQLPGSDATETPIQDEAGVDPPLQTTPTPEEPTQTPTSAATETTAATSTSAATATVIDQISATLTPDPTAPATATATLGPESTSQRVVSSANEAEVPVSEPPVEPNPWLPIERIQRSADSQPGQVLVDEDPTSVWTANGVDQPLAMFVLDLGQPRDFSQVTWLVGQSGQSGTLYISVSNDGSTWTDLDPTRATQGSDGWVTLDAAGSGQFIRFIFVNDSGADWLGGISEVRIMP